MSKARLLADLMRDSKISLAEVSGDASAVDFNVNEKAIMETQLRLLKFKK